MASSPMMLTREQSLDGDDLNVRVTKIPPGDRGFSIRVSWVRARTFT
jgi:hypothetical protein